MMFMKLRIRPTGTPLTKRWKLPKELWQVADESWLRHYGEQSAALIEGVGETLLALRGKGYQLAVVTSGSRSRVCREVEQSVLRDVLAVIVCNEDIVNKKPHPEGLARQSVRWMLIRHTARMWAMHLKTSRWDVEEK